MLNGIIIGQKVKQPSVLPEFILKDDCASTAKPATNTKVVTHSARPTLSKA